VTGRDKILRCGYHGWHDWCVEVHGGVPESWQALTVEFPVRQRGQLWPEAERTQRSRSPASVLTPVGHPLGEPGRLPPPGYLEAVRELCREQGSSWCSTKSEPAFACRWGRARALRRDPDLTTVGKAMANG